MRKLQILVYIIVVLILITVYTFAFVDHPLDTIAGWFMREPYYDGKSIGYWAAQLRDGNSEARFRALMALQKAGPKARSAIPAIAEFMEQNCDDVSQDGMTRFYAARLILETFGPEARVAIPTLKRTYQNARTPYVWTYMIETLIRIDEVDTERFLVNELSSESWQLRERAAHKLNDHPTMARRAVDALRRAATDLHPEVRRAAESALRSISQ